MKFIHATDSNEGVASMAARIASVLNSNRPVLWLVCGGSNVFAAADALESIKAQADSRSLALLTVGQTDERYGAVGHADSNWRQLKEAGFDFDAVKTLPILIGEPLEETVAAYSRTIEASMDAVKSSGGLAVALFGSGADGHIAGILPHSPAVNSNESVCGYEAGKFTRVTLTPKALKRIGLAYAFVFGGSKKEALRSLRDEDISIDGQPAQMLKESSEAFVYSDQF